MRKLKMKTVDIAETNIEKISAIFPNCVTETKGVKGQSRWAVDFDLLRQELTGEIFEGGGREI